MSEINIFQKNVNLFVIVAAMAGASSVIFIRVIEMNPVSMGFYRLGFSILMFAVPVLSGGYKGYKGLTGKDVGPCVIAGLLLFCHFYCWFAAVKNTSIASASVLFSLHPLVVLFVTVVILKQKVKFRSVIGILIILTGGAIIAGGDHSFAGSYTFGNIMAFMSAVFFGSYFIIGRALRAKMPLLNYVFLVFGVCWLFFAAAMFVTRTPFTGYTMEDFLWVFGMAIVCQITAHVLYNWCVRLASSLYVSVWASLDPVFATLFGIIFFLEIPAVWQCVGGAIAISGLIYYNYNEEKV